MAQWVKDTEAAGVAAGTRIPSLAQEFTHALGMVKKKKKKRRIPYTGSIAHLDFGHLGIIFSRPFPAKNGQRGSKTYSVYTPV